MNRPDEKLFLQHAEHFQEIDNYLESFCKEQGFVLDKNLYRTPCRVLRKRGNPELIIDIYQEGNWLNLKYIKNLPHTFAVAGYYEPTSDDSFIYKLEYVVVEQKTFYEIVIELKDYLTQSLVILNSWTQETFQTKGTRVENLKKKFAK